jgi:hypothetical protein
VKYPLSGGGFSVSSTSPEFRQRRATALEKYLTDIYGVSALRDDIADFVGVPVSVFRAFKPAPVVSPDHIYSSVDEIARRQTAASVAQGDGQRTAAGSVAGVPSYQATVAYNTRRASLGQSIATPPQAAAAAAAAAGSADPARSAAPSVVAETPVAALASEPLPEHWTLQTTPEGHIYYWHSVTGESRWTRPEPEAGAAGVVPPPPPPLSQSMDPNQTRASSASSSAGPGALAGAAVVADASSHYQAHQQQQQQYEQQAKAVEMQSYSPVPAGAAAAVAQGQQAQAQQAQQAQSQAQVQSPVAVAPKPVVPDMDHLPPHIKAAIQKEPVAAVVPYPVLAGTPFILPTKVAPPPPPPPPTEWSGIQDWEFTPESKPCCLLFPSGAFYIFRVALLLLIIVYNCAIIPFRMGFGFGHVWDTVDEDSGQTASIRTGVGLILLIDWLTDAWQVVEIGLKFRTAYVNAEGLLVYYRGDIEWHYFASVWFWIDLLAVLPFDFVQLGIHKWWSWFRILKCMFFFPVLLSCLFCTCF